MVKLTRQPRRADTHLAEPAPTEVVGLPPSPFPLHDSLFSTPLPRVPGYEILRLIDQGGMSNIYLARQLELERNVAIKMIRPQDIYDEGVRRRFLMEASSIAALQHPNVVQIYEIGESDGMPYLCLEYIDGGNLEKKIQQGAIKPREAAAIVRQLAQAIDAAHRRTIIHRDLKPSNVLCLKTPPGAELTVKVTDFGLARMVSLASDQTKSGYAIGTPSFMSPEQASGRPEEVTESTDIYGLGAILYELLTGVPPFEGATALETIQKVRYDVPTPPSLLNAAVPRALERICLQCLEKSPHLRYPTAEALADDLDRFLRNRTVAAHRVGPVHRWVRRLRREPARVVAFVTLPALLVAAFIALRTAAQLPIAGHRGPATEAVVEPDPLQVAVLAIHDPTRSNPLIGGEADLNALGEVAARHPAEFAVQYAVGEALLRSADPSTAAGPLQRAATIAEERTRHGEAGFETWSNLAFALERQGDLNAKLGTHAAAKRFYERSMQLREMLMQDDPRDARWPLDLAGVCGKLAACIARENDFFTAVLLLDRRLGLLQSRAADLPTLSTEVRDTHRRLADLHEKLGNPQAAEHHRREADASK